MSNSTYIGLCNALISPSIPVQHLLRDCEGIKLTKPGEKECSNIENYF